MSSETVVQQQTRLTLARMGCQIWRNNSGACEDKTGRLIRYGLGNDSAQLNARIKSSDLIGIVPAIVQPADVGRVVGLFAAFECKRPGWHLTAGDERGQAQQRFIDLVRSAGGVAGFVSDAADVQRIIRGG